jgi:UDP-N-acetyl-D-mannosaminuronic acid dehydrogenase
VIVARKTTTAVNILNPGPGVGGHCIAVDPWFIVHSAQGLPAVKTAREVNDSKPMSWSTGGSLATLAAQSPARLAYKPTRTDLRERPAI